MLFTNNAESLYPRSQFGNPFNFGIATKKSKSTIGMSFIKGYYFNQNKDNGNISKLSLSYLHKSGVEFSFIKSLNDINKNLLVDTIEIESDKDLTYDVASIAMNIKQKRYGVSLHFTTYNPNIDNIHTRNPREYGISLFKRFRKKVHRPFIYYSFIEMYNGQPSYEYLAFGSLVTIKSIILGTYISVPIEGPFNLVNDEAQFNLALGFHLY